VQEDTTCVVLAVQSAISAVQLTPVEHDLVEEGCTQVALHR